MRPIAVTVPTEKMGEPNLDLRTRLLHGIATKPTLPLRSEKERQQKKRFAGFWQFILSFSLVYCQTATVCAWGKHGDESVYCTQVVTGTSCRL